MFEDLISLEYSYFSIQDFEEENSLSSIQFSAYKGTGSSYYIEKLILDYLISSAVYFADTITLNPNNKRLKLGNKKGMIKYSGQAFTSNNDLYCDFDCSYDYLTTPTQVNVELLTDRKYLLGQWNDATYDSAGCEKVPSPRGLYYLYDLPVTKSVLLLDVISSSLWLNKIRNEFEVPSFAIGTEVLLEEIFGVLVIEDAICSANLTGV